MDGHLTVPRGWRRHRYAADMRTTLCARPGCPGTATAWLTYDYGAQQVWLDDAAGLQDGNQWGLCGAHAGRLRAPNGWTEIDRRVGRRARWEPPTSLVS
jgi:hypothetical protein